MVIEKVNKLIKKRGHFFAITVIFCAIYIIFFLILLMLSIPHPILTFLVIISVAPGCWLLVHVLFKYKAKLENNINAQLTKILRQEFQKEFEKQKIYCVFDIKPVEFNSMNIVTDFDFCYFAHDVNLYGTILLSVSRVKNWINGLFSNLHYIDIFSKEDFTLESNEIIV